jgi:solute:Na+ symporter, SSS family
MSGSKKGKNQVRGKPSMTGVFASRSGNTIRKNAVLLPAYTLMLGLLALLGYMGHAAHLRLSTNNDVVPALFQALFPNWFAGFAFAAIAIGALVPAAVMSIGAADLFTRNFWKAYVNPQIDEAGEAAVAKITSLVVKVEALLVCRRNSRSTCSSSEDCGSCRRCRL